MRSRREPASVLSRPSVAIGVAAILAVLCLLPFDARISLSMADEPDGVKAFLGYATDVGLVAWYLYPALLLLLALLVLANAEADRRSRRRRQAVAMHGAYFAASVAIAQILVQILKAFFGRARPVLLDDQGPVAFQFWRLAHEYASFPSGHSATMGAVTVAALIWFPTIRWPLLVIGMSLAVSRIVVEAHFASDVVAGWTIGFLVSVLFARWLAVRRIAYRIRDDGQGWRGLIPLRRSRLAM